MPRRRAGKIAEKRRQEAATAAKTHSLQSGSLAFSLWLFLEQQAAGFHKYANRPVSELQTFPIATNPTLSHRPKIPESFRRADQPSVSESRRRLMRLDQDGALRQCLAKPVDAGVGCPGGIELYESQLG